MGGVWLVLVVVAVATSTLVVLWLLASPTLCVARLVFTAAPLAATAAGLEVAAAVAAGTRLRRMVDNPTLSPCASGRGSTVVAGRLAPSSFRDECWSRRALLSATVVESEGVDPVESPAAPFPAIEAAASSPSLDLLMLTVLHTA